MEATQLRKIENEADIRKELQVLSISTLPTFTPPPMNGLTRVFLPQSVVIAGNFGGVRLESSTTSLLHRVLTSRRIVVCFSWFILPWS